MRISARRRTGWLMSDHSFESRARFVHAGGTCLEVVELGRGEPIVLVPGLAGGWKLLTPLARQLARTNRVYLCGYRDEADPLSSRSARDIGDYAHDLSALIGELGLERPTVFGVSFGGAVALEFAVEEPNRLGRLILSGVEARFRTTMASKVVRRVLERFPLPEDNPFVNQFFNLLHGDKPEPGPTSRFLVERCWETDQGTMGRRLAMLENFDVSDRLWRLEAPTLVLAGTRDFVVPTRRQEALAHSIDGARFVRLEAAGHVGFLTHPGDVARHVSQLCHGGRHSIA